MREEEAYAQLKTAPPAVSTARPPKATPPSSAATTRPTTSGKRPATAASARPTPASTPKAAAPLPSASAPPTPVVQPLPAPVHIEQTTPLKRRRTAKGPSQATAATFTPFSVPDDMVGRHIALADDQEAMAVESNPKFEEYLVAAFKRNQSDPSKFARWIYSSMAMNAMRMSNEVFDFNKVCASPDNAKTLFKNYFSLLFQPACQNACGALVTMPEIAQQVPSDDLQAVYDMRRDALIDKSKTHSDECGGYHECPECSHAIPGACKQQHEAYHAGLKNLNLYFIGGGGGPVCPAEVTISVLWGALLCWLRRLTRPAGFEASR